MRTRPSGGARSPLWLPIRRWPFARFAIGRVKLDDYSADAQQHNLGRRVPGGGHRGADVVRRTHRLRPDSVVFDW